MFLSFRRLIYTRHSSLQLTWSRTEINGFFPFSINLVIMEKVTSIQILVYFRSPSYVCKICVSSSQAWQFTTAIKVYVSVDFSNLQDSAKIWFSLWINSEAVKWLEYVHISWWRSILRQFLCQIVLWQVYSYVKLRV